jgi:glycosyltransferase involved in cell wall biosynthesis
MTQKLKIAIDVSPLNNGNSVRGVGYYTNNLVSSLQKETADNPEFQDIEINLITQKQSLTDYDLVHYPYFDPFCPTLPTKKTIPTIISIHDLMPRQFKSHYPVGIKGELIWQRQRFLARKSNYIITDSHYSKYIIADLLNYPSDHIYVTHLAADPSFKPIKDKKILSRVKTKYHLPDKFILYVGDINWNKNIPGLVKACQKLNYPLVLVGSAATSKVPDHPWTKDILWLQSQHSPLLTLTGFVPDADLPIIFNLATVYCQPSYAEGFGLPVVQAMQSNTPVVYSQKTSLPEIMDKNGEIFDPYQPGSLETALKKLWEDENLRKTYQKLGLKRSQIFNWQYTAIQTLTLYQQALRYGR